VDAEWEKPKIGPAASAVTGRKRLQAQQLGQKHSDSELAQQLLLVLQQFSNKKTQNTPKEKPDTSVKKGKGRTVPANQSSLIHSLCQILQSAVDNQWSDDQIVTRLTSKLNKVVLLGLLCPPLLVYPPLLSLRYERMELRVECKNIVELILVQKSTSLPRLDKFVFTM